MSDSIAFRKIVWAVDPLAEDLKLQRKLADVLKKLTAGKEATIEPVYVMTPNPLQLVGTFYPEKSGDIRTEAEGAMHQWLTKQNVPGLAAATILESPDMSLHSAANAVIEYSKKTGAHLIALCSFARQGMSRFLLGSFAETLILHSPIPILVVNPSNQLPPKFKEVLFPTDFSSKSKDALQRVIPLVRDWNGTLILYHQAEYVPPATLEMLSTLSAYEPYMEAELLKREQSMKAWVSDLQKQGLKVESVFNKKGGSVAAAILSQAKKMKSGLVAMASQSGPVASLMLGSVTRQVIRHATCPVWVLHP